MDYNQIKVGIVSLTVGNWDLMPPHIQSIYDTYKHPKEFYIIPNVEYEKSLSAAINAGFKRALKDKCDYIVYSADDVVVGENAIQDLIEHIAANDLWIVNGVGTNTSGWDMFICVPDLFREVGFWDESYYPAYFEDNTFARMLSMRDDTKYAYIPIKFDHLGSQTIRRLTPQQMEQHHENFARLERMYRTMWGGGPGGEVYTTQWNGNRPDEFEGFKTFEVERWTE